MSICVRCDKEFEGRWPKSKICKQCSRQGMPRGEQHWNYKKGSYTYETIRRELKEVTNICNRCNKDLTEANRWEWCIHHIDHNHYNNDSENLELLCKSCHQIEHEAHRNFEGATTSRKAYPQAGGSGGTCNKV